MFSISPLLLGNEVLCLLTTHIVAVIERRIVAHSLDAMVNRLLLMHMLFGIILMVTVFSHKKSFRHFGRTMCVCKPIKRVRKNNNKKTIAASDYKTSTSNHNYSTKFLFKNTSYLDFTLNATVLMTTLHRSFIPNPDTI